MAFTELHYFSQSIGKQLACNILIPDVPAPAGGYPVFYLLHGLSDDHSIWCRRTRLEMYVDKLPLIVVMPDGGRSFYIDGVNGDKFEHAVAFDLVDTIDRMFRTRASRGGRCIGGLSMGGYGAMRLAMGHPNRFVSANSHSGALRFGNRVVPATQPEYQRILGPNPVGGINDLFKISSDLPKEKAPALRIDCGMSDFLLEDNRAFAAHLKAIGMPHDYAEYSGGHHWDYWDLHVQEAITFHRKHLGI